MPAPRRDAPAVTIISDFAEDGKPIGEHGDGELDWHTDLAFTDGPSAHTTLLAREVPPSGGNTSFANMYAAAEAPRPETRARSGTSEPPEEGPKCKHQASHNAQDGARPATRTSRPTTCGRCRGRSTRCYRVEARHPASVPGQRSSCCWRRRGSFCWP
jgi:taurine dioxygenase